MTPFSNPKVQEYVNGLSPLQQSLVLASREAVLAAGAQVKEDIKWGSIAFYNERNICGYRVAKAHVTLLFMEGATLPDPSEILQGTGAKARTIKLTEENQVPSDAITQLVKDALALGM
ncbi:MAG: DUF1801 domain-containing protein [Bacteroidia bacterium]|nr:DUF1801 domain-containing protein [Bacteroidia bacterium]